MSSLPELPEINVTPLVDVMLVLVVLLLLVAPMIGKTLPVNVPKVIAASSARTALPKLEVQADGRFKVDGVPSSIQAALNIATAKGGAVLYADKSLSYDKVAKALSIFAEAGVPLALAVSTTN
jgi:biopolymer transport protein ExbD